MNLCTNNYYYVLLICWLTALETILAQELHNWSVGCVVWANDGECGKDPEFMCKICAKACFGRGCEPSTIAPTRGPIRTQHQVSHTHVATTTPMMTTRSPSRGQRGNEPFDYHAWCCFWAKLGECNANPAFMCPFCQVSCGTMGCTCEFYRSISKKSFVRTFRNFVPKPNITC